jgi:hypothetical protein
MYGDLVNCSSLGQGGTIRAYMEQLSKLLGSPARVKLLRLFVFNPESVLDRDAVAQLSRITPPTASKELMALARADIVTRKTYFKDATRPGTKAVKKRKSIGWVLNPQYAHLVPLRQFLRETLTVSYAEVRKRLRSAGSIRLLVLSGFLIGGKDAGLDILIVGNKLNEQEIKTAIRSFEAEFGVELRYAVLPTEEYQYRRRVRDKLVRDVMDFPHEALIDQIVE